MSRVIAIESLEQNLQELFREIEASKEHLMIYRDGQPCLTVLPIADYERWFAQREEAFAVIDDIRARNLDRTADEVEVDVEEAIRAVRAGEVSPR